MKIKLLILICLAVTNMSAQTTQKTTTQETTTPKTTTQETKTIFGNEKLQIGYFISPTCQFAKIAGTSSVLPGIGAGVIFNKNITLGLTYKFIFTENTPVGETNTHLYLDQQYAGIKGEYSFFPEKVIHLNLQLEAGLGHTELDLKDSYEFENFSQADASFGYLEPGVALEINLWKYLKMDIGVGYRFVSNVNYAVTSGVLTEKDFMGLTFSAAIKIGLF